MWKSRVAGEFLGRCFAALSMTLLVVCADAGDVVVNASKVMGTIRALHGVNGGPVLDQELVDLSEA